MIHILFVCMGNICRSPLAAAVVREYFNEAGLGTGVVIDSAGTHASHSGEAADPRARQVALKRAYPLSGHRARRIRPDDFEKFDLILAMDRANLSALASLAPPTCRARVALFLGCLEGQEAIEVPDPYYGNLAGFERVQALCEAGAEALVAAYKSDRLPVVLR